MMSKKMFAVPLLIASLTADAFVFSTQFDSGRVPAVMSVEDADQTPLVKSDYKNGYTENGWTVVMVNGGTYAAVSPTHTGTPQSQHNILSTPEVELNAEGGVVRWRAKSIHPQYPEAYGIYIVDIENDAQATCVYQTDNEPVQWTHHMVDISEWAGKKIKVQVICNSVDKYMLAIDDLCVGVPDDQLYEATTNARRYVGYGNGVQTVEGEIVNYGMSLSSGVLRLKVDGEVAHTIPFDDWKNGKSLQYAFNVPLTLNESSDWTVEVHPQDMSATTAIGGTLICSHFPRTLLLTEFSGMWCNSCPKGINLVESMEHEYGGQLVSVCAHVNDALANTDFLSSFSIYSVPWMMLNHDLASQGETDSKFGGILTQETPAMIEITGYEIDGSRLDVKAGVKWCQDVDNSTDRYRIAYMLTKDFVSWEMNPVYYQENSLTTSAGMRFYYLPSRVPSYLAPMYNVVVDGEFAHAGRPYTLPSDIKGGKDLEVSWAMTAPTGIDDLSQCRLVATIVDSTTGHVINACAQKLDSPVVGINEIIPDYIQQRDTVERYYTLNGIEVSHPRAGIYICKKGNKVTKQIIR